MTCPQDYGTEGCRFEPCQVYLVNKDLRRLFKCFCTKPCTKRALTYDAYEL